MVRIPTASDPLFRFVLLCVRSESLQLLHWHTCKLRPPHTHILSGCRKKKEPQKSLQGRDAAWAADTCRATALQRRGESMEDGAIRRTALDRFQAHRQLVHICECTRVPSSFNSWHIQNRISFTISEIYDWPNETIFFSPTCLVSVGSAVTV